MSRKGRVRLGIDVPDGIHRCVKEAAKRRNCTITKYIIRLLVEQLAREKNYDKQAKHS